MDAHYWVNGCKIILEGTITIGAFMYPSIWAFLIVSKILKA